MQDPSESQLSVHQSQASPVLNTSQTNNAKYVDEDRTGGTYLVLVSIKYKYI